MKLKSKQWQLGPGHHFTLETKVNTVPITVNKSQMKLKSKLWKLVSTEQLL